MHRSHDPGLYPANRYFKFPAGGCAEAFWRAQLALGKISLYYTRFYFPLIFHVSPKQKSKHADYRLLLLSLLVPSLPALSAWVRAAHRYCFCFARGRRKIDVLINYPDRALARISEQKLLSALLSELVSSNLQVAIIGCNANPWLADICSRLNISIIDPESGNAFSASRVANCVVLLLALMDYTVIKYHLLASLIQVDSTLWKSVSREARRTIFVDRISKSISFKTVILRCEWESYSSQLIDIAQAKGAPTIAFQHGVISHTLDAPCKVDHYMAFGRQSADLLKILSDTFFMATGKHNSTKLANFHPVGSFIDAIDINVNNYSRRTVLILDQYVEQLASFYGLHMGQKCLEKLVLSLSSLKSIRKIIFRPHPYSRSTEFIEKSTTRLGDKFHVSSKGATLQSDIKQSSIAISRSPLKNPARLCENGATAQLLMRGQQERSGSLFSYVSIEERIPANHPLRRIRKLADQALDRLNPTFCSCMPQKVGHRCRRSSCCWLLCCRRSTASAPSGCCWSSSTTTCCSAGLSA
jgi:hypothetical protein